MYDLPPHRPPAPLLRRASWTLLVGVALGAAGALLTLVGIALVGYPPPSGPPVSRGDLDPGLSPECGALARKALPAPAKGVVWRIASYVRGPWGPVVRLRPYVVGLEVRGADCILDPSRQEWTLESGPSGTDWKALAAAAAGWRAQFADSGSNAAAAGALLRAPATPLTAFFAARIGEALTAVDPPAGTPQDSKNGRGGPHAFVSLRSGADPAWTFEAELRVPAGGLVDEARAECPWIDSPPPGTGPWEVRITVDPAAGTITRVQDSRFYDAFDAEGEPDGSTGWGLAFDPNPVVMSGRTDLRPGDPVDGYRVIRELPRLDGTGDLAGRWVRVRSDRPPLAEEPGLDFAYPTVDPRFAEVMAYLHVDRSLQRVDSLGFHGLFVAPLYVRVHGTALDNSWYSRPQREVVLGDGGVDDAEDADIILHESAHAIHDALVPGFGDGNTLAISEGFADFWAASLTDDPCVGNWDATAYGPPCLRRVDGGARYPSSLTGQPHADGELWSGTLWDLRQLLGARTAETLALSAFLEQGTATTWEEAAAGLLRAAGRIGLEPQMKEIRTVLAGRGFALQEIDAILLAPDGLRLAAWPNPFRGETTLRLCLSRPGRVRLDLFDVTGREVRCLCDQDLAPGDASFTWDGRDARGRPAPSGIYWAQAEAPGAKRSVRILRLR